MILFDFCVRICCCCCCCCGLPVSRFQCMTPMPLYVSDSDASTAAADGMMTEIQLTLLGMSAFWTRSVRCVTRNVVVMPAWRVVESFHGSRLATRSRVPSAKKHFGGAAGRSAFDHRARRRLCQRIMPSALASSRWEPCHFRCGRVIDVAV